MTSSLAKPTKFFYLKELKIFCPTYPKPTSFYVTHTNAYAHHHYQPRTIAWWVTNSLSLTILTLLGEWLCIRREMADIPIGSVRDRGRARVGTVFSSARLLSNGDHGGAANSSSTARAPGSAIERLGEERILVREATDSFATTGPFSPLRTQRTSLFGWELPATPRAAGESEVELPVSTRPSGVGMSGVSGAGPGHVSLHRTPSTGLSLGVGIAMGGGAGLGRVGSRSPPEGLQQRDGGGRAENTYPYGRPGDPGTGDLPV